MKHLDTLITTQKNKQKKTDLVSMDSFWKNQEKPKKYSIFDQNSKKWLFLEVFLDFFQKLSINMSSSFFAL